MVSLIGGLSAPGPATAGRPRRTLTPPQPRIVAEVAVLVAQPNCASWFEALAPICFLPRSSEVRYEEGRTEWFP